MRLLLSTLLMLVTTTGAFGAVCEKEDFETRVSGTSECLLMRRYGSTSPTTMVVWLHGNISSGGPANYHFPIAQKFAVDFASDNVLSVALVRPGYPDGNGEYSSGDDGYRRADNWPRKTIAEVGTTIERLRLHYKPKTVIIVGHSGGAATAAVLLGMKPKLAEAAVLVSCPCDLIAWRLGRAGTPWSSENPILWIDEVPAATRVIALTGTRDDTTSVSAVEEYIQGLKARGIDAVFLPIPDAQHRDALGTAAVSDAIGRLLRR
jgi:pimeloyl-ACP methyl ester carboxylesterase